MIKEECQLCMQPITNPVCGRCYTKHVASWLEDMRIKGVPREIILGKIKKATRDGISDVGCIVCGRDDVALCSYCFFLKAEKALMELNMPDNLLESFRSIFNYTVEIEIESMENFRLEENEQN